jgi:hypothetical protein
MTCEACQLGKDTISASDLPETVRLERCPVGETDLKELSREGVLLTQGCNSSLYHLPA